MEEQAHGIVLRTRPLTESSLIVHWLTEQHGRLATVARGARRPKSALRGKLDLLYEARFSFQRSKRSDLHHLREVTLLQTFPNLRTNLRTLTQAAYAIRLLERTTETETPLDSLYPLFFRFLQALHAGGPSPLAVLRFEAHLLEELGLAPDWTTQRHTPETLALWRKTLQGDWNVISQLRATPNQVEEIDRTIRRHLLETVNPLPRGRGEALEA